MTSFWSRFACFGDDLGLNSHGSEGVELNDGGVRVAWRVFCILLHICALYAPFHSFCISNTVRLLSHGSRPRQEALGWGCHDIAAQGELTSQAHPKASVGTPASNATPRSLTAAYDEAPERVLYVFQFCICSSVFSKRWRRLKGRFQTAIQI